MKARTLFVLIVAALLCLMIGTVLAEPARVVTPKGPLNMRKTPEDKGKLMESVPNKSLVEVDEVGETWTKITYKKKTGYVKTEYLKLAENMVGKEIYADEGTLYLRKDASADAPIVLPVGPWEPVTVEAIDGDWVKVSCQGYTGYVEIKALSYQNEEPTGEVAWLKERATVTQEAAVRLSADTKSETVATVQPGDEVTVTVIEKDQCLVITGDGCGYVSVSALALTGPEDSDGETGGITPSEALAKAEAALKKKYKTYAKEKLYGITSVENGAYRAGFFNDQDQYLFAAIVDGETGKVEFTVQYDGFAVLTHEADRAAPFHMLCHTAQSSFTKPVLLPIG